MLHPTPQKDKKETSTSGRFREKRFFEAFRDMLFTATQDWKILEVNQAGARIFGYAGIKEMLGIDSIATLFWNQKEWHLFLEKIEARGFIQDAVAEMKRHNGSHFPASISATLRIGPGNTIICEGLLRDMSS